MTLDSSRSVRGPAPRAVSTQLSRSPATPPPSSAMPTADASFTGGVFPGFGSDFGVSTTLPATMLDGNPSTYWSNRYSKVATQTLNGVTNARPDDWVSVTWAPARQVSSLEPRFILDANDELPASATVYYWNGSAWAPVSNQQVTFATGSNAPSTITFDPVEHHCPEARDDKCRSLRPGDREPRDLRAADPRGELAPAAENPRRFLGLLPSYPLTARPAFAVKADLLGWPIAARCGPIGESRISASRGRGRRRAARWRGAPGRPPRSRPRRASRGAARWCCVRAAARTPRSRC